MRAVQRILGIAVVLLVWAQLGVGCGDGDDDGTGPQAQVAEVEVSSGGTNTIAALGATLQFTAVAKDASGGTISGQTFTWTSSAPGVATVNATGLATALASGVATITAMTGAVSGDAALTVRLSFAAVSAGFDHSCGVTTAGVAYCWGDNVFGQLGDGTTTNRPMPVAVAGGLSFAAVSTKGHTCGVTTAGDAYCWGQNVRAQLGDGTTTDRLTPVAVAGGLSFAAVSAGFGHSCGVTTAGDAYCWGSNGSGMLGDGTFNNSSVPVLVLLP